MRSSLQPDQSGRLASGLLDQQLHRMRGMLFSYSSMFFVHMRVYTMVTIGLLVSLWEPFSGAVLVVPFLTPFVFIEASYLFWYTVFARRHAERLERALATRSEREVPAAHRLESAYFYAPDDPTIAALDLRRPALAHECGNARLHGRRGVPLACRHDPRRGVERSPGWRQLATRLGAACGLALDGRCGRLPRLYLAPATG
jgi:hypothetical protein